MNKVQVIVKSRQGCFEMGDVVCNGCTLCCQKRPVVILQPEETIILEMFPSDLEVDYEGWRHVRHNLKTGDCVFLNRETGCTVNPEIKPQACKTLDCRFAALTSMPGFSTAVYQKGNAKLLELERSVDGQLRSRALQAKSEGTPADDLLVIDTTGKVDGAGNPLGLTMNFASQKAHDE